MIEFRYSKLEVTEIIRVVRTCTPLDLGAKMPVVATADKAV